MGSNLKCNRPRGPKKVMDLTRTREGRITANSNLKCNTCRHGAGGRLGPDGCLSELVLTAAAVVWDFEEVRLAASQSTQPASPFVVCLTRCCSMNDEAEFVAFQI